MTKKQKLILLTVTLSLIILSLGLSYAFFSSISNNESASTLYAKGGTMNIKYANGSGNIVMENIYPREKEWVNKTFTVTGNNTTELSMDYRIYLVTNSNAFNYGDLTYSISGTSTNTGDTLIQNANQNVPKSGEILIGTGTFKSKTATHSYNLRIFYKETGENQNNGQGKNYTGRIKIATGSTLAYDSLMSQSSSTSTSSPVFNGPITKTEVESIAFKTDVSVPANALFSWDASEKQNGSVMAYALDTDNNNLYEVYIGQNEKIILGPDAKYLFANYSKSTTLDVSNLDTSHVTNMSMMFYNSPLESINGLDKWNTSNVTDMSYLFSALPVMSLDLYNFDTSKVTDMSGMFRLMKNINDLDLSSFDTSKVTNMSTMFFSNNATSIKGLNNFNTSNVTKMDSMFSSTKVTTLNLSNFNTSKVIRMDSMFANSQATSLDVSNFDTSNVTRIDSMFANSQAKSLDVSSFDTSNVTRMDLMFAGSQVTSLDLSGFDTSKVTDMSGMFSGTKVTTLNLSNFNTSNVTDMSRMFNETKVTTLNLSSFDTLKVTIMSSMFTNSQATSIIGLNKFNTSKVTRMDSMFAGSQATSLDLSSFDTSKVTNMSSMFSSSKATTGYARTQADADRFNASSNKPSGLTFTVKS